MTLRMGHWWNDTDGKTGAFRVKPGPAPLCLGFNPGLQSELGDLQPDPWKLKAQVHSNNN